MEAVSIKEEWRKICSQDDIDELLGIYGDFHDACLASASYQSGASVNDENAMRFGVPSDYEMLVIFHSQWKPKVLEMRFVGLRQCHITGWQDNYIGCISEAHLAFYEGLLPGKPDKVIIWADNSWFDKNEIINSIQEPSDTYIVANSLLWRIREET